MNSQKKLIRSEMRRYRRSLSPGNQSKASRRWKRSASQLSLLRYRTRIAAYHAVDGEIDLSGWISKALQKNQKVYLPVLHPFKKDEVWFVEYKSGCRMRLNRFQIPEPDPRTNTRIPAWMLDVICLPLVAFDVHGNRLGMGGGFYDRVLKRLRDRHYSKTFFIGCAHQGQQVEQLPVDDWDEPLNAIVTDQKPYYRRRS